MRILIVAMADSIHTSRWINQIADQGWDIHLFPSIDLGISHPDLPRVTIHHTTYHRRQNSQRARLKGVPVFRYIISIALRLSLEAFFPHYRARQLAKLIKKLKPDIVHSLEIQAAGYLTLEAKKYVRNHFPPWIVTNWGSDIYLFGRLKEHAPKIRAVLQACQFYSCECYRDVDLAKQFGFTGTVLPVFPNAGGFSLPEIKELRSTLPASKRTVILVKGYQGWAGRALVALRALSLCKDVLQGYSISIYSASESSEVKIAAELLEHETGVPVTILPKNTSRHEILRLHGQARISIGLSISDAISTSFLEALAMGSFPIQSNTSCANEWVENNKTALLVPPEDPERVALAIRTGLTDDHLVDSAQAMNDQTVQKRLNYRRIKPQAVTIYRFVMKQVDNR